MTIRNGGFALLAALLGGCGLDPGAQTSTGPATPVGFGSPTLEVTVAGVHYGPAPPDPGSAASLVDTVDSLGHVVQSTFTLSASLRNLGAACSFVATREDPEGTAPIGPLPYQIVADTTGQTADATVSPGGTESVLTPQVQMVCSGTDCNGSGFQMTALDATHAEGYFAGTWFDIAGGGAADITCSFYLPVSAFQP